jgi:hypothetical protein
MNNALSTYSNQPHASTVYCGASLSARCPHGFRIVSAQCLHRVCTVSHDAGKTIFAMCSCGVEGCSSVVLEGF